MTREPTTWRRIEADGAQWEARVVASPRQTGPADEGDRELLEFVCVDGSRKSRQVAIAPDSYGQMDEAALRRAFVQARPIGGDHYGRPGKQMNDTN
jgi:hypothetical protein